MHTLFIGNKNYSSWSLRAWLAFKKAGIDFQEKLIRLDQDDYKQKIISVCNSGTVPILIFPDGTKIPESLAICEYANDVCDGMLYPKKSLERACARAYAAEMHSGFFAIRENCPMNIRKHFPNFTISEQIQFDIHRIETMWNEALSRHSGKFLFGDFSIADAMFAPIVLRFLGYDIKLKARCTAYMENIVTLPEMQDWITGAKKEPWIIPEDEA